MKVYFNAIKASIQRYQNRKTFLKTVQLSDTERQYLEILQRDGICVIDNYWSQEKCREVKQQLEAEITANVKDKDYSNGAYIRFNKGKTRKDEGVARLYHAEKRISLLHSFRFDPLILKLAGAYYGIPMYSNFIAFQHNFLSSYGTREYHVDWWDHEFKAFLYLEDVTLDNGPFSYIVGSNKAYVTRNKKLLKDGRDNTSFHEKDLNKWIDKEKHFVAKAGSLILADVVGFHRGLPQLTKTRSILYNNLYSKNTEQYPQK
jgi:hypothetical protein